MTVETQDGHSQFKVLTLSVSGWFVGCVISILALLAMLTWKEIRLESHPKLLTRLTIMFLGMLLAAIGTWVGVTFYRPNARTIGSTIAITFIVVGLCSWAWTDGRSLWPTFIGTGMCSTASLVTRLLMNRSST
jgi:uncharacterized membrane protein